MKYIPNALSLSRVPLSILLFVFAIENRWQLAAVVFMVALMTDALDGFVARRFGVESDFGGEVLEPMCDLLMSGAAVAGLYFGGAIPLWVPLLLLAVTGLLQASHSTPFTSLKRHTYYLHPLFFLAVVYFAGLIYLIKSLDPNSVGVMATVGTLTVWVYQIGWAVAAINKADRLKTWFAGPPLSD